MLCLDENEDFTQSTSNPFTSSEGIVSVEGVPLESFGTNLIYRDIEEYHSLSKVCYPDTTVNVAGRHWFLHICRIFGIYSLCSLVLTTAFLVLILFMLVQFWLYTKPPFIP